MNKPKRTLLFFLLISILFLTLIPSTYALGPDFGQILQLGQRSIRQLILIGAVAFGVMLLAAELVGRKSEAVGARLWPAIGILLVAVAGSLAELAISVQGALMGETGLVVGDIIGSNVANIALVLGISAMIRPLKIEKKFTKGILAFLVVLAGVFVMFFSFSLWPNIGYSVSRSMERVMTGHEGLLLIIFFVSYVGIMSFVRRGEEMEAGESSMLTNLILVLLGGVVVWYTAEICVISFIQIANFYGISTIVLGATIVALGTSLPELSISTIASIKGKSEIVFGNLAESNAFDMAVCLGIATFIIPLVIAPELALFHIPFMIIANIIVLGLLTREQIGRGGAMLLLVVYIIYIILIVSGIGVQLAGYLPFT